MICRICGAEHTGDICPYCHPSSIPRSIESPPLLSASDEHRASFDAAHSSETNHVTDFIKQDPLQKELSFPSVQQKVVCQEDDENKHRHPFAEYDYHPMEAQKQFDHLENLSRSLMPSSMSNFSEEKLDPPSTILEDSSSHTHKKICIKCGSFLEATKNRCDICSFPSQPLTEWMSGEKPVASSDVKAPITIKDVLQNVQLNKKSCLLIFFGISIVIAIWVIIIAAVINIFSDLYDNERPPIDVRNVSEIDTYSKLPKSDWMPNGVSQEEYFQIEEHMTYAQVSAIIGGDGQILESDENHEGFFTVHWPAEQYANATVTMTFENYRMVHIESQIPFDR